MAMSPRHAAFGRLATAGALLALAQAPAEAADPSGNWWVSDRTAQIRIESCGSAGYYGVIDWEKRPGIDENNRDPQRRGKPLNGVAILLGLQPGGPDRWQGQVYNPKDGGTYFARVSLNTPTTLRLEGCILGGLLCDGETWTRAAPSTTGAAPGRARSACPAPQGPSPRRM